ncbi:MAG: glycoside hydrolase family 32 protein [Ruminococcaceae bacterium]|nr:glycoside hydrolase family 32 protein [Oscillospiraceae bacterium]
MKAEITLTRKYREHLLSDPYRPTYHFAICDDLGIPGDSNGAFFADGVYHLMYLYKNTETESFHWGHISSLDCIHWRHHPDALTGYEGDRGCFSGGGFVDEDGTAYLSFWKFPAADKVKDKGGIALACSKPPYEVWERMEPIAINSSDIWGVTDIEVDGQILHIGCADPSNIWKINDKYYMQTGNKVVLDRFGREENSDLKYQGDWVDLFSSDDLKDWHYVGRFYDNPQLGIDGWPDKTEDDMCPSFLPLYDAEENGKPSGKYLQLFISHNKGCQYYVGTLENERFTPEQHGRMSWKDTAYFAPEALIDNKNRHIMWAWMRDNLKDDFKRFGWSGVFGVPRNLWYEEGELKIAPISELDSLQYNRVEHSDFDSDNVDVTDGMVCRLKGVWNGKEKAGLAVRVSDDGNERVEIYYSPEEKKLIMDTTKCGTEGWRVREEAPFELRAGEKLSLDVLIDKSMIEVFANKRQAISRRAYPTDSENCVGIKLIGAKPEKLESYKMFPANPY